jgi:hypothetical protein
VAVARLLITILRGVGDIIRGSNNSNRDRYHPVPRLVNLIAAPV